MTIFRKLELAIPPKLRKKFNKPYHALILVAYSIKNKIKYGQADFFHYVSIEVNSACNRRCKYCPNSRFNIRSLKNQKLMPEKVFKKVVDELSEIGFDGWFCPDGYNEPLLDKRIVKLMAYARKKLPKCKMIIYTNGDYLTPKLYQQLIDVGVNKFTITEHGESMTKNMKDTFDYIKRNKLPNNIEYLKFDENTPLYNRGGLIEWKTIDYHPECDYPFRPVDIDFNGNIILCCNDFLSSIKFGNVAKEKLVDIWNKPHYKEIRRKLRKRIYDLPICKRCTGQV